MIGTMVMVFLVATVFSVRAAEAEEGDSTWGLVFRKGRHRRARVR